MNDSRNNGASAIVNFLVIALVVLLLGGYMLRSCNPPPRPRNKCLSNLKQIGLALKQYALDYNKSLPFGEGIEPYQALGKLHPNYASALEVFRCPSSHDKKWDINNAHEQNNKDNAPFKKDACKISLSYAYGHNKGKPWTEEAPSTTRLAGDKYATEDYSNGDSKKRPSNHKTDGRNVVYLDGSARWDNNKGKLEADTDWDVKAGMLISDPQYVKMKDSEPEHDQTGTDWWSDPPDKR